MNPRPAGTKDKTYKKLSDKTVKNCIKRKIFQYASIEAFDCFEQGLVVSKYSYKSLNH